MGALLDDQRKIEQIVLADGEIYVSGIGLEQSIRICSVNGEMAPVCWFEILDPDGNVLRRINGKYVTTVVYAVERADK